MTRELSAAIIGWLLFLTVFAENRILKNEMANKARAYGNVLTKKDQNGIEIGDKIVHGSAAVFKIGEKNIFCVGLK